MEPEDEENVTSEEVRKAQQLAGELQWVSSRTRPDICFAVSKIGGWTLRAPRWATKMAMNVVRYLGGTLMIGIHYDSRQERNDSGWLKRQIEVYTDASFAPGGTVSHHCCIMMWAGSPLAWTSTRQPFPALSTAEAELIAMLEGLVLGESVGCLVEEIADYQEKTLFCDNTAAVALATAKGGSWRTRHLKVRAAHLRYKTETEEWKVKHKAGLDMVADIGTKALKGDRITVLNELMKVVPAPRTAEGASQALEADQRRMNYLRFNLRSSAASPTTYERWFQEDLGKVAKLVALIELFQTMQTVAATNSTSAEPFEEGGDSILTMISAIMVVVGMILVKVLEKLWSAVQRPQIRMARLLAEESVREEPVMTDDYDENIATVELRRRRGGRGVPGGERDPDGEARGDLALPPPGGLAAARGRPGGVAAARITEEELFAAADALSGEEEDETMPPLEDEVDESMLLETDPGEQMRPERTLENQVNDPTVETARGPRWRDMIPEQSARLETVSQEQRLLENLLEEQVTVETPTQGGPRRWRDMSTEEIIAAAVRGELSVSEEEVGTLGWGSDISGGVPGEDEGAALGGAAPGDELHGDEDPLRGVATGPIITPRGDRFHKRETCPTLARSQPTGRRFRCQDCGVRYPEVTVVFLYGSGVVHTGFPVHWHRQQATVPDVVLATFHVAAWVIGRTLVLGTSAAAKAAEAGGVLVAKRVQHKLRSVPYRWLPKPLKGPRKRPGNHQIYIYIS